MSLLDLGKLIQEHQPLTPEEAEYIMDVIDSYDSGLYSKEEEKDCLVYMMCAYQHGSFRFKLDGDAEVRAKFYEWVLKEIKEKHLVLLGGVVDHLLNVLGHHYEGSHDQEELEDFKMLNEALKLQRFKHYEWDEDQQSWCLT